MATGVLRLIGVLGGICLPVVTAAQPVAVDELIRSLKAEGYECPSDQHARQIDSFIGQALPVQQAFYLKVRKAQYLACGGRLEESAEILDALLSVTYPPDDSENLAYALYLAGIVTSNAEQTRRCDYYRAAEQEALRVDAPSILLGAQLELTSTCDIDEDNIDKSLAKLYALLEKHSSAEDQAIRSDIFNNIGNLYAILGQHELAGDQYLKSYQMSQGNYTGETLLTPLFNAVTAYLKSGRIDQARSAMDELIQQNAQVNTPLTNAWVQQAQAIYALHMGNFQLLKDSLVKWAVFLPDLSHPDMDTMYRRMQAQACLHERDERCLKDYLTFELQDHPFEQSEDLAYLRLLIQSYRLLDQPENALLVFDQYDRVNKHLIEMQQSSSKILGVAQMLSDIVELESNLEKARQEKALATMRLVFALALVGALLGLLVWLIYRRQRSHFKRDHLTGLFSSSAAVERLKRFGRPSVLRVHALALFNVDGIQALNPEYGPGSVEVVLQQVAEKLQQASQAGDVIGRMGSQEFLVCLYDIDEVRAKNHLERLYLALTESTFDTVSGQGVNLSAQYSVMILDEAPDDVIALYQGLVEAMAQERRMQAAQQR
ncbi:hypothetical protein GCM10009092_26270 [Bowmanella denitrificans]|uniref:GGDEF domain-containing protein n=1 Tax=Bowmanella denitrificans TaxID=366582 RepID=A0ABN0XCK5_9ALTE